MKMKTKTIRQAENDAVALRPGAGVHGDRRTKRCRTRTSQKRRAIADSRY